MSNSLALALTDFEILGQSSGYWFIPASIEVEHLLSGPDLFYGQSFFGCSQAVEAEVVEVLLVQLDPNEAATELQCHDSGCHASAKRI